MAAVTKFTKASIKAFAEAEKEAQQLRSTLEAVNLGFAAPLLNDYIGRLELLTGKTGGDLTRAFTTLSQASTRPSIDIFQLKVACVEYNLMYLMNDDRIISDRAIVVNNQLFLSRHDAMRHGISELRQKIELAIDWVNKYEQLNQGAIQ